MKTVTELLLFYTTLVCNCPEVDLRQCNSMDEGECPL
jgi:hypothetical protein